MWIHALMTIEGVLIATGSFSVIFYMYYDYRRKGKNVKMRLKTKFKEEED